MAVRLKVETIKIYIYYVQEKKVLIYVSIINCSNKLGNSLSRNGPKKKHLSNLLGICFFSFYDIIHIFHKYIHVHMMSKNIWG